jgi:adenylate cyclase
MTLGLMLRYILTGGPSKDGMPSRVLVEIDLREAAAERLIGWVQLCVVVFFASIYTIAPRATGATGTNFVPEALAIYFAFTVFRLWLSYRITLPGWFLVISIAVDVALLCGLIFSFHLQYSQPAAFYLKAPTMLYMFIFIGVRTLRVDPRFVLITGIGFAIGWLGLLTYALVTDMGDMRITRDFVAYLTSNSILIGAEIDKMLTILGVTAILTIGLYRGRQVLFDAVKSNAAAHDLEQFFAPDVAQSITGAEALPSAGRGATRVAAILFVDVRGFTLTAETLEPGAVIAILTRYQEVTLQAIEQHGGQVDKFLGDGILATFGAVHDSPTYAADALRAAQSVITALHTARNDFTALGWPHAFDVGASAACGTVTVGVVGARGRLEFTVIGNAVNLAAKLESANKVQGTRALTDADTYALAQAQGFDDPNLPVRPAQALAGLARAVDVVVLA